MPNAMYLEAINTPEHQAVFASVGSEVVGKPVTVCLIKKAQQTRHEPQPAADASSAIAAARKEPLVQKFLDVFRGDLAQVKPVKEESNP